MRVLALLGAHMNHPRQTGCASQLYLARSFQSRSVRCQWPCCNPNARRSPGVRTLVSGYERAVVAGCANEVLAAASGTGHLQPARSYTDRSAQHQWSRCKAAARQAAGKLTSVSGCDRAGAAMPPKLAVMAKAAYSTHKLQAAVRVLRHGVSGSDTMQMQGRQQRH